MCIYVCGGQFMNIILLTHMQQINVFACTCTFCRKDSFMLSYMAWLIAKMAALWSLWTMGWNMLTNWLRSKLVLSKVLAEASSSERASRMSQVYAVLGRNTHYSPSDLNSIPNDFICSALFHGRTGPLSSD